MLKNKTETKQILNEWRKVLNEGLYDHDPELLEEGWKEKLSGGLAALMLFVGGFGAKDAAAYPTDAAHTNALSRVAKDLKIRYGVDQAEFEERYPGGIQKIAADKTLETIYYMLQNAMRDNDFDTMELIKNLFEKLKPEIKNKNVNGNNVYYLPMDKFDKFAKDPAYKKLFDNAAKAASDVSTSDIIADTKGAEYIAGTTFQR